MEWKETLENFSNYLKFERNFSDNTLDAYIRDITKFKNYAEDNLDNSKPIDITYENLQEYLLLLSKEKISERTQSRWISSIKSYFKYLLEEEIREELNVDLINPKLVKTYPVQNLGVNLDLNTFIGSIKGNIKIKDDELLAYGWFSLESVEDMKDKLRGSIILDQLREALASLN